MRAAFGHERSPAGASRVRHADQSLQLTRPPGGAHGGYSPGVAIGCEKGTGCQLRARARARNSGRSYYPHGPRRKTKAGSEKVVG